MGHVLRLWNWYCKQMEARLEISRYIRPEKKPGRVTICLFGSLWEINSLAHQNCNRQKWGHATVFFCHQKFEMRDEKGIQNISNTRPHQNGNCTEKNDFTVPNLLELPISQNPCRNHAKTIPLLTTERSGPFWYTSFRAKQTQDNKKYSNYTQLQCHEENNNSLTILLEVFLGENFLRGPPLSILGIWAN